jgi:hypothetical protein
MTGYLDSSPYPWSPSTDSDLASPELVDRAWWILMNAQSVIERMSGGGTPALPHLSEIETLSESQLNQLITLCQALPSRHAC